MDSKWVCARCGRNVDRVSETAPWRHLDNTLLCPRSFPTTPEIRSKAIRKRKELSK